MDADVLQIVVVGEGVQYLYHYVHHLNHQRVLPCLLTDNLTRRHLRVGVIRCQVVRIFGYYRVDHFLVPYEVLIAQKLLLGFGGRFKIVTLVEVETAESCYSDMVGDIDYVSTLMAVLRLKTCYFPGPNASLHLRLEKHRSLHALHRLIVKHN